MHFTTDRQTIEDLNIFGKRGDGAIYSLFNHTQTRGGAALMEQLFHEPLSRPEAIRNRIGIIQWFFFADAGLVYFPANRNGSMPSSNISPIPTSGPGHPTKMEDSDGGSPA